MASGSHSNYSSSGMIRDDPKRQIKCVKYVAYMETMYTRFQCENLKRRDLLEGPRQR
jgi:hypothetical protein